MRGEEEEDQAIWSKYFEKYTPSSIYPSFILKSRNPFMHAHLFFLSGNTKSSLRHQV
jgi:hypothetical protein